MVARIIDEYIDPAELELRFLEHIGTGSGVCNIHREDLDLGLVAQLLGDRLELAFVARDKHEVGACIGKHTGGGRAAPLGSASNDDGLVVEDHWGMVLERSDDRSFRSRARARSYQLK